DERVVAGDVLRVLLFEENVSRPELVIRERWDQRETVLPQIELRADHVRPDGLALVDEHVDEEARNDVAAVAKAYEKAASVGRLVDIVDVPLVGRRLHRRRIFLCCRFDRGGLGVRLLVVLTPRSGILVGLLGLCWGGFLRVTFFWLGMHRRGERDRGEEGSE